MRRIVAFGTLGVVLALPAVARAESSLSFRAGKDVLGYGRGVTFTGALSPAAADQAIQVYRVRDGKKISLAKPKTRADGTFHTRLHLWKPGRFFARVSVDTGGTPEVVRSETVRVKVRPFLHARFEGTASIGSRLLLKGNITPKAAGVVVKTVRGRTHRVKVHRRGGFHFRVPTGTARPVRVRVEVKPRSGYVGVQETRRKTLELPVLTSGSHGRAVRALERQLRKQHYLLRNVNRSFGYDTLQAVYAYQWVHGLAKTGRVDAHLWRKLARTGVPRARRPSGDHLEISKSHQTIYEVRGGKVVNVIHTSTGATGNTPVGTWHVYWKDPGYNAIGMYYSMYFLRGFAIHGYHSVPPWPASHGCGRIELWAAPSLFGRWGVGSTVVVFP